VVEDSGCNSVIPKFTDDSSKLKGNKEIEKLSIVFQSNAEICDVLRSNVSYRVSSLDARLAIRNAREIIFIKL